MAEAKNNPVLAELGASGLLVFRHLDRISDDLAGIFSITKQSADKLMLYSLQVHHLETLLISDLDKEYYAKFEEKVKPILDKAPIQFSWQDIKIKRKFFLAYNEWAQILILQARKKGYLGRKKLAYGLD